MAEQHPFRMASFCFVCAGIFGMRSATEISREMMLEWGLHVDHTTIYRWGKSLRARTRKRCRPHAEAHESVVEGG
jgi:hypothetical protein